MRAPSRPLPLLAAVFLSFSGPAFLFPADCNSNGIDDDREIAEGKSPDCNANGIPDGCDANPAFAFHTFTALPPGYDRRAIGAWDIAVADFSGDGLPDAAILAITGLIVMINAGDGTFTDAGPIPIGSGAYSIDAGDLDGDRDIDLAIANPSTAPDYLPGIRVLLNQGNGAFGNPRPVMPWCCTIFITLGDLDGQKGPDLLSLDYLEKKVFVQLNRGDGAFTERTGYPLGEGAIAAALGDFDGDGDLDVAAGGRQAENNLMVLLNQGDGTLVLAKSTSTFSVFSLAAADFDQDGRIDLAAGDLNVGGGVAVFRNFGWATLVLDRLYPLEGPVPSIAAADLDRDGFPDLALSNPDLLSAAVLRNRGDGTLQDPLNFATGGFTRPVKAADVDGDGDLDLIAGLQAEGLISILHNRGDGVLQSPWTIGSGGIPAAFAPGDFDGDGDLDFAACTSYSYESFLHVYENLAGFRFEEKQILKLGEGIFNRLAAGDFDGDGDLDLLGLGPESDGRAALIPNNGNATFKPPKELFSAYYATSMLAQDLNGDGDLDLALSFANGYFKKGHILAYENQGAGAFIPGDKFYVGFLPAAIAAADLDGDGKKDLASANENSHSVSLLFNRGDGSFSTQIEIPLGKGPAAVLAADLDGDEDLDLAAANSLSDSLFLLLNGGGGRFGEPVNLPAGKSPRSIAAADFDGDELLDLAAANFQSWDLSILFNRGQGTFGGAASLMVEPYPLHLHALDLDGDGDPDLALTGQESDDILDPLNGALVLIPNRREELNSLDRNKNGVPDECENPVPFKRGDFNGDAALDIGDPIALLSYLFLAAGAGPCLKSGDANDDAKLNIADAVRLILHLFGGRGPLPEPFLACGPDPTPDTLSCESFEPCR